MNDLLPIIKSTIGSIQMNPSQIASLRLRSQQVSGTPFKSAGEIVSWMGAMQAQDFNMALWAIGLRLNQVTGDDIRASVNSGDIIRTHVLRPTWHFVSPADIYWMLELSAPRIRASMRGRNKQLELTEKIFAQSNRIFEKRLRGGKHLTRKELLSGITDAGIATNNNRSSHLLFNAELEGILCSGKMKGRQTTYALLGERVRGRAAVSKEEALGMLARKYFESHAPATLADFIWWSGLAVADAKRALDLIRSDFASQKIKAQEFWFPPSLGVGEKFKNLLYLLPAFDEFLISYKDRGAAIHASHQEKAFTNNGIFRPVIVSNGRVVGIWKTEMQKDKILLQPGFFAGKTSRDFARLEKATEKLGYFLNYPIGIRDKS